MSVTEIRHKHENDLYRPAPGVNILYGGPAMGKSELVKDFSDVKLSGYCKYVCPDEDLSHDESQKNLDEILKADDSYKHSRSVFVDMTSLDPSWVQPYIDIAIRNGVDFHLVAMLSDFPDKDAKKIVTEDQSGFFDGVKKIVLHDISQFEGKYSKDGSLPPWAEKHKKVMLDGISGVNLYHTAVALSRQALKPRSHHVSPRIISRYTAMSRDKNLYKQVCDLFVPSEEIKKKVEKDVLEKINNNIKFEQKFAVVQAVLESPSGNFYCRKAVSDWMKNFTDRILVKKVLSAKALEGLRKAGKAPKPQIADIELYVLAPFPTGVVLFSNGKTEVKLCANPYTHIDVMKTDILRYLEARGVYVKEPDDEVFENLLETI